MRLSRQFQACLFFFFFTKRFRAHKKHQNIKQATFTLLEFCAREKVLPLLFSVSLFLFCWFIFACDVFLCARNLFVRKKINRLEIELIISFYYTTDVYPYQPTHGASIYMHLFLLVTICDNFFEFFLFVIVCENLPFLSLYENKQAYEHHHLKQIFCHKKQIMKFC